MDEGFEDVGERMDEEGESDDFDSDEELDEDLERCGLYDSAIDN
jgi:hypothetical protein